MRLSRRSGPFDSDEYIFELKIDGFRSLAYIENGQCGGTATISGTLKTWRSGSAGT
jgi:hypothetical protein